MKNENRKFGYIPPAVNPPSARRRRPIGEILRPAEIVAPPADAQHLEIHLRIDFRAD
jgi:hypothetical protein